MGRIFQPLLLPVRQLAKSPASTPLSALKSLGVATQILVHID
jgi:hypothetical protein